MENDFRTFELSNTKERATFRNEEKIRYCAVLSYNIQQHYGGIHIFTALRVICRETETVKYRNCCLQAPQPPQLPRAYKQQFTYFE